MYFTKRGSRKQAEILGPETCRFLQFAAKEARIQKENNQKGHLLLPQFILRLAVVRPETTDVYLQEVPFMRIL